MHVQCGPQEDRAGHRTSQPTRSAMDLSSGGPRLSRRAEMRYKMPLPDSRGEERETRQLSTTPGTNSVQSILEGRGRRRAPLDPPDAPAVAVSSRGPTSLTGQP